MLTLTILTMGAEPAIQPLHDRQPVILADGAVESWIASGSIVMSNDLDATAQIWPVTPRMSSPRYEAADSVEPLGGM